MKICIYIFHTWGEVLDFYCDKLEQKTGSRPKVKMVKDSKGLQTVWNPWQIRYDRLYNRTFNNSKIESIGGKYNYKSTFDGLEECLDTFLKNPKWLNMSMKYEAWCDRQTGEFTPLQEVYGHRNKLKYLKWRLIG